MSDEKPVPKEGTNHSFRGGDPRMVDIDSPAERAYWIKYLDTSEEKLRAAVHAVGPLAQKVRDYLKDLG